MSTLGVREGTARAARYEDGFRVLQGKREVDLEVANRKLAFLGIRIDKLTPEQEDYLNKSAI